jgi:PHD/YefM family antitoxin component YafN of YafNO toxin-antitoxin module
MKVVEEGDATSAEYPANVASAPVVVTNQGQPVAVLVAIDDTDLETIALGSNPEFLDLIERSRARVRAEGGISSEEMRRRFE